MRGLIEQHDINQFHTREELEAALGAIEGKKSKSQTKKDIKSEGVEVVHENDKIMIISPNTYEASQFYGKGSKWCTAMNSTRNYWDSYYSQGVKLYYIIHKKTDKKYAVAVYPDGRKSVFDQQDKSMTFEALTEIVGPLM